MAGRKADPRVGYFTTGVQDFTDDLARTPRVRYVNRWRLEKKDPAAALSEPVRPITFWLDRTIPVKYREAMTRGILEWNKAFEKIGFKNAMAVQVQPDDADFDTLDVGVASIRWMTNSRAGFGAIGPSHVDPRSGEILDADIGFESLSSRFIRTLRSQILASRAAVDWPALMQSGIEERGIDGHGHGAAPHDPLLCTYADQAAEQLGYALDVLDARGELDPGSPEAQQFVLDYLTDTTMHEVGHTLGLAPQLPFVAPVHRPAAVRPGVHAAERPGRLCHGVRAHQPRQPGRAQRGAVPAHAWALRLLGDRIRLQAHPSGSREARAGAHRRPQCRAAAGLRHRRGQLPRHRSGVAALRPRQRRARVRQEAHRHRARPAAPAGTEGAEAERGLLRAAPVRELRVARCRPCHGHPGPPDRRRAHAARLPRHRARPAGAGAGGHPARGAGSAGARRALGRRLPGVAGAATPPGARLR